MSGDPLPDPRPGERWIGGANGGHPFGQVTVLQVAKRRVRLRFLSRKSYGKIAWMDRYQFVVQFRPVVT